MSDHILVEQDGPIATVVLNRPEKLNALSTPLVEALSSELTSTAEDESVRVVILGGAGRSVDAGPSLPTQTGGGGESGAPGSLQDMLGQVLGGAAGGAPEPAHRGPCL